MTTSIKIMDEKLDLILSRLTALEADLGELKIAASEKGRLADCTEKDPALCELFIVEGDLAGMSCKQGRNPRTQAVLRLEGKILNVEKARFDKKLTNSDFHALGYALGAVMEKNHFDIKNLRYHKIILLCEDHVEGSRFGDLLLSFFLRHMPQLLEHKTEDGETKCFVYRAQPPFYQIWNGGDGLNYSWISGASGQYLRDDQEMNRCLIKKAAEEVTVRIKKTGEKIESSALSLMLEKRAVDLYQSFLQPIPPPYLIQDGESEIEIKSRGDLLRHLLYVGAKSLRIQRFEHLGEMTPQQLWESTLDPEKRTLLQIKFDDAVRADELYTALISEQIESRSVQVVLDGLSEAMNGVKEDIKEIKRDLKDLTRSFNTLAGDGARLRAAYEELDARLSTLEHKPS